MIKFGKIKVLSLLKDPTNQTANVTLKTNPKRKVTTRKKLNHKKEQNRKKERKKEKKSKENSLRGLNLIPSPNRTICATADSPPVS